MVVVVVRLKSEESKQKVSEKKVSSAIVVVICNLPRCFVPPSRFCFLLQKRLFLFAAAYYANEVASEVPGRLWLLLGLASVFALHYATRFWEQSVFVQCFVRTGAPWPCSYATWPLRPYSGRVLRVYGGWKGLQSILIQLNLVFWLFDWTCLRLFVF